MKAIILAAGYATRLYPLTKDTPKPLLDVGGRPIIDHIIDKLPESIDRVFVVTNSKFAPHFERWRAQGAHHLPITVVDDGTKSNEDRLGSLGDIRFVVETHDIDDDLLVVAGDNLFRFSLEEIHARFTEHGKPIVALFDVKDRELAKLYGIVALDEASRIISFEEKPAEPKSTLSSTGIYFYPRGTVERLLTYLDEGGKADKAGDFLAWLHTVEETHGHIMDEDWHDIGSHEQLEEARRRHR